MTNEEIDKSVKYLQMRLDKANNEHELGELPVQDELEDALAIIDQLLKENRWIPVSERLPEEDGKYMVYAPSADAEKPFTSIAWYNPLAGWSVLPHVWIDAITHWKSIILPEEAK